MILLIMCIIIAAIPVGMSIAWSLICDNSQSYEEEVSGKFYQRRERPYKIFETKEKYK